MQVKSNNDKNKQTLQMNVTLMRRSADVSISSSVGNANVTSLCLKKLDLIIALLGRMALYSSHPLSGNQ